MLQNEETQTKQQTRQVKHNNQPVIVADVNDNGYKEEEKTRKNVLKNISFNLVADKENK